MVPILFCRDTIRTDKEIGKKQKDSARTMGETVMDDKRFIPLVTRKFSLKVWIADIIYIQKKDRKIKIMTDQECYEYYEKLQNIEQYLDKRFYHCLKTLVVNLDKIDKMTDQTIFFQNGETFFLGRENYIKTKQTYSAYLKKLI